MLADASVHQNFWLKHQALRHSKYFTLFAGQDAFFHKIKAIVVFDTNAKYMASDAKQQSLIVNSEIMEEADKHKMGCKIAYSRISHKCAEKASKFESSIRR